jgi:hypothetical protein
VRGDGRHDDDGERSAIHHSLSGVAVFLIVL